MNNNQTKFQWKKLSNTPAYQILFENGLNSMIDYLNSHQNKDFPYIIDAHKLFVNLKYVPNGKKEPATNFYINQFILLKEFMMK